MIKIKTYKILFIVLNFILVGTFQSLWSQGNKTKKATITFSSVVKNTEGLPLEYAKVYGNQGSVVTKTNEKGVFTISVNIDSDILIESEGYNSITVNSMTKLSEIVLTKDEFLLGKKDILNSSFHNVKKGNLIGNISKINVSEILRQDNLTNFQTLLDSYGAGMKGGYNLLGLGDALVIVDGLPRDASTLLPEEIEDISILRM